MQKLSLAALVAVLVLAAAGCGGSSKSSSGSTTTTSGTTTTGGGPFKVGLVTDIGGLNDRGFNHLAYVGLQKAQRTLHVQGRVVQSKSPSEYVPNLSALARQGYNLVIGVGFTQIEAMKAVAKSFPKSHFAIVDVSNADEGSAKNVEGLLFKEQEVGYLAGYAAALAAKAKGANAVSSVGGQKQPPGRPLHRRLPGRCEGRGAGHQDAEQLLAGLREPGEVQGDRAQPDRRGLRGRLPGRGRLRSRRARRGQGEGRVGDRRRRRPGLPRPAHPHLRAEGCRHRRVPLDQRRQVRQLQGRPGRGLRPRPAGRRARQVLARRRRPASRRR